jgi:hypothetical protein
MSQPPQSTFKRSHTGFFAEGTFVEGVVLSEADRTRIYDAYREEYQGAMTAFDTNASYIKKLTDLENTVRPDSKLPDTFWLDVEATEKLLTELNSDKNRSLFPSERPPSYWTKQDQDETR